MSYLTYRKGNSGRFADKPCPDNSLSVTNRSDCETAATFFGLRFGGQLSRSDIPKGCIRKMGQNTRVLVFNTHETGAKDDKHEPICIKTGI